jgi:hypothetical protein
MMSPVRRADAGQCAFISTPEFDANPDIVRNHIRTAVGCSIDDFAIIGRNWGGSNATRRQRGLQAYKQYLGHTLVRHHSVFGIRNCRDGILLRANELQHRHNDET